MPEVVRVRTRETLVGLAPLILRAARVCGFPTPGAVLAEMVRDVASAHLGIFVGYDGREPCGVAVGQLPTSAFYLAATVHLAYSEPRKGSIVDLVSEKLRAWFMANGVYHVLVANIKHTDRAYMRGLAHFGSPARVGGVIRFDF